MNISDRPAGSSRKALGDLSVNTVMATPGSTTRYHPELVPMNGLDSNDCIDDTLVSFQADSCVPVDSRIYESPLTSRKALHHIPYTPNTDLQSRNLTHSQIGGFYPTPVSIKTKIDRTHSSETSLFAPKPSIDYSKTIGVVNTPISEIRHRKVQTFYHDSPIASRIGKVPVTNKNTSTITTLSGYSDKYDYKACAKTLKLRLGLAYYKVRTNQTKTPLQQLPIPGQVLAHEEPSIEDHGYADLLVFAANCIASQKSSSSLPGISNMNVDTVTSGSINDHISQGKSLNSICESNFQQIAHHNFTTPVKLRQSKSVRIDSNDSLLSSSPSLQVSSSTKGTPSSMKAARSLLQLGCS